MFMRQTFRPITLLIGVLALSLGFQNCSSVKMIERARMQGTWQLKTLKGESATDAFKTSAPTLTFNFTDKTIHGSGGCNNYTGVFSLTNKNEFSARNPVSTMRACLDANKEPQFYAALATPNMRLSLADEGNMLVFSKGDDVILEFIKASEVVDAKQLVGTWTLVNISGGDVNKLFHNKPTLEIAEDGKIVGNGGCNTLRTSYTLDGNTITFKGIASTKMACPSLEGENLFTSHLASPLQVAVAGDKISFSKDGVLILEFEKNKE